jgi:hypothetical protein
LGTFDRDERGNIILLTNERGQLVDKKNRRVNEKGYLLDQNGNVVETTTGKKMFTKVELDERGELPAPYCLEKHNFNAHEIKGDVDEIPNETASSTTGGHGTKAP